MFEGNYDNCKNQWMKPPDLNPVDTCTQTCTSPLELASCGYGEPLGLGASRSIRSKVQFLLSAINSMGPHLRAKSRGFTQSMWRGHFAWIPWPWISWSKVLDTMVIKKRNKSIREIKLQKEKNSYSTVLLKELEFRINKHGYTNTLAWRKWWEYI